MSDIEKIIIKAAVLLIILLIAFLVLRELFVWSFSYNMQLLDQMMNGDFTFGK